MTTSIIAEPFYEGVTDEESAEQAITAVYDRLGANENTQLMLDSVYGTEGLTYRLIQEYIPETGRVSIIRSMPMNKSV